MTLKRVAISLAIGVGAGAASGLLGVGGGIVMVPLLVSVIGMSQHHAHATSLAAIVLIAAAGAVRFGLGDSLDVAAALLLAAGSLVGSPLGARFLDRVKEAPLKIAFGALTLAVALVLALVPA